MKQRVINQLGVLCRRRHFLANILHTTHFSLLITAVYNFYRRFWALSLLLLLLKTFWPKVDKNLQAAKKVIEYIKKNPTLPWYKIKGTRIFSYCRVWSKVKYTEDMNDVVNVILMLKSFFSLDSTCNDGM